MFGLLSPEHRDAAFCQAYTHLCQTHREFAGVGMLPFHSYEGVSAYLLAVDTGLVSLKEKPVRVCCQLKEQRALSPDDEMVSRFTSALSTLLAHIKLKDDAQDNSSLRARIMLRLMSHRFEAAYTFFGEIDDQFRPILARILDRHAELERSGCPQPLSVFSEPTADGFGYVFSLLPQVCNRPDLVPLFRTVGEGIGAAIIAFDAAYDFAEDRRNGAYNPLIDQSEVTAAVCFAKTELAAAASAVEAAVGPASLAAKQLRSVVSTLTVNTEHQVTKTPSLLDESVMAQCSPQKVFGFVPVPFLAQTNSSDSDGGACILAAVACGACLCINAATKNSCLGRTEGRRDMCGNITVQRKGPCE